MPFSERQKELIEKHLFPDETFGEQPTAKIELNRRQLRFLVEAVQYYHESCCPGEGKGVECGMLTWGEDVHTGALERACALSCGETIAKLLSDEVLASFPTRAEVTRRQ
jgi:hypothetical protein